MLDKLLSKLGYITRKESLALRYENFELKEKLRNTKVPTKPLVDIDIGDPAPADRVARREYVARSAAFYKDILEPKTRQMISEVNIELANVENGRGVDWLLKGTINCCHLFRDWGEMMISEHVDNQTNRIEDEELEIIKDKIQ